MICETAKSFFLCNILIIDSYLCVLRVSDIILSHYIMAHEFKRSNKKERQCIRCCCIKCYFILEPLFTVWWPIKKWFITFSTKQFIQFNTTESIVIKFCKIFYLKLLKTFCQSNSSRINMHRMKVEIVG